MQTAELSDKIKNLKKKKLFATVLVGGTFDLIHPGHIEFLEKAKQLGDVLIVGVASDKDVKKRKGIKRPIQQESHRLKNVISLKPVDYAFITDDSAYSTEVVQILTPDILAFPLENKTKMHRRAYKPKYEAEFSFLTVEFVDTEHYSSTTEIIDEIIKRHV